MFLSRRLGLLGLILVSALPLTACAHSSTASSVPTPTDGVSRQAQGAQILHVDDATFDSAVLRAGKPSLVIFTATWCEPCKAQRAALAKVATNYRETLGYFNMDIDESPDTPSHYQINHFPTVSLFRDGRLVDSIRGNTGFDTLSDWVRRTL